MLDTTPIQESTITSAWREALIQCNSAPGREVYGLEICIAGSPLTLLDIGTVEASVDHVLASHGEKSTNTVANTIFPWSTWLRSDDRTDLYERYARLWPRIRRASPAANKFGTYFQRMISYELPEPNDYLSLSVNHLEDAIQRMNLPTRRAALQIPIAIPTEDITKQRQRGFPCMFAMSVVLNKQRTQFYLRAHYPMQYVDKKCLGNLIGVTRVAAFVEKETGIECLGVRVEADIEACEMPKRDIEALILALQDIQ